jgi:Tfp pilus assembly protein PilN
VALELRTLIEIDFLPASYRQRGVQRRAYAWRVVAALAIVGFLGATTLWLRDHHTAVLARLSEIDAQFAEAAKKNARLATVTAQLQAETKTAELLTFLRHRWPRTQILSAILEPLPAGIVLTELRTGHDPVVAAATSAISLPQTESEPTDRPSRRSTDLRRLLKESAQQQAFVFLTGQASDAATLHEYLARLGNISLFSSVDLKSLEHEPVRGGLDAATGAIRFTARLIVRVGHGQTIQAPTATEPLARRGE